MTGAWRLKKKYFNLKANVIPKPALPQVRDLREIEIKFLF